MEQIQELIEKYYLELSMLTVFARTERNIHRKEYETIKNHNLTPMQFGVLEALYTKGELTIGQLIEKNLSTSGNMTVVIRNLERDGWIHKVTHPEDKRIALISLTEAGRQRIESILPEHYENVHSIFAVLTEEEKQVFKSILKKVSYSLEERTLDTWENKK